jgi:hypothetical protein
MTPCCGPQVALDFDRVFSDVAEVVRLSQRLCSGIFKDIDEVALALVERTIAPIRVGHSPSDIAGTILIEATVAAAHRGLDRKMKR